MWADLTTWLDRAAKTLLQKPPSDDDYPNDRLPSEQLIGDFALRGYRGPTVLVSAARYFKATKLSSFTDHHIRDMARRNWPVAKAFVETDVLALEQLAEQCDAVRVVPAF